MRSHRGLNVARASGRRLLTGQPTATGDRAGATAVIVVTALVIVGLAAAALVKTVGLQRHVVQAESSRLQAEWLATSGAQRAALSLQAKSEYAGEVWDVSAEELGRAHGARVEIKVSPDPEAANRRRVVIHVELSPGSEPEARITREVRVSVGEPQK